MSLKVFVYAEGSALRGMGHLFRMQAIWTNHLATFDVVFLAASDLQTQFYSIHKMPYVSIDQAHDTERPFAVIVDSKDRLPEALHEIWQAGSVRISVDSLASWAKHSHYALFPSFYPDLPTIQDHLPNVQIKAGREYCLIRDDDNHHHCREICVTFGGSDPNNVTSSVLLALDHLNMLQRTSVIVGPAFKVTEEALQLLFPKAHFISGARYTSAIISRAKYVITALGTTLQEAECHSKSCLVIFNYAADKKDYENILRSSRTPALWRTLGFFQDLSKEDYIEGVKDFLTTKIGNRSALKSDWGRELGPFLQSAIS